MDRGCGDLLTNRPTLQTMNNEKTSLVDNAECEGMLGQDEKRLKATTGR